MVYISNIWVIDSIGLPQQTMQRLVELLLHKTFVMARSTFEGPVLSGTQRFGNFRNVGYVDLVTNRNFKHR
jgi:hypothetical protein